MLIELHCGLPWEKEVSKERIEWKKLRIEPARLLEKFPSKFFCPFTNL